MNKAGMFNSKPDAIACCRLVQSAVISVQQESSYLLETVLKCVVRIFIGHF